MMIKSILVTLIVVCISLQSWAQVPREGAFSKERVLTANYIPYPPLSEKDVVWSKRLWQEIDLRDRQNAGFLRLTEILIESILNEELTAYDPTAYTRNQLGDEFENILSSEKLDSLLGARTETIQIPTLQDPTIFKDTVIVIPNFDSENIIKYRIKEDWVFDRVQGRVYPRISGIAPIVLVKNSEGDSIGVRPIFWIYFDEVRPLLATYNFQSIVNDALSISMDDAFVNRMFTSQVILESNPANMRILDYPNVKGDPEKAKAESDRIMAEIYKIQNMIWEQRLPAPPDDPKCKNCTSKTTKISVSKETVVEKELVEEDAKPARRKNTRQPTRKNN